MPVGNGGRAILHRVSDYVVFDLETTGVSWRTDNIVELSAIKVAGGTPIAEYSSLVNPERPIPYYASRVNGITDDMVEDAPCVDAVLHDFLDFAGNDVLVGHNIRAFDMKFINRDCDRFLGFAPSNDFSDTLVLARRCLPHLSSHKLTDVAAYFGISTDGAHRALADCRMNQAVYEHLAELL